MINQYAELMFSLVFSAAILGILFMPYFVVDIYFRATSSPVKLEKWLCKTDAINNVIDSKGFALLMYMLLFIIAACILALFRYEYIPHARSP